MNETEKKEPRKIWTFHDAMIMPRGIDMQPYYHADGSLTFVGQYFRAGAPKGAKPKRVYRIEVMRDMDDWRAVVYEDRDRLAVLCGDVKWNVAYAALGALRSILHKRCSVTGTNRRARKAAQREAANPVNPVNPV